MSQSSPEFSPRDDDLRQSPRLSRGCCFCIRLPCFSSPRPDNWERISTSDTSDHHEKESVSAANWLDKGVTALKKVREWSELVAGPKWKTFIRRFNRSSAANRSKSGTFQYDPMSYALNFDEGAAQNGQFDDDRVFRDFSSRYAAIRGQSTLPKESASLFT